MDKTASTPRCGLCGEYHAYLPAHLMQAHGMTAAQYLEQFPGAPTISGALYDSLTKRSRRKAPKIGAEIRFAGIKTKINKGVPLSACLPMPDKYRVPSHGALADKIQFLSLALKKGRSAFVWGPAGTGKDAVFHAWSALTRTPGLIFTIKPGVDIESWFFQRAFTDKGTFDEEGVLLKALKDGYVSKDGKRHPYMILISDFDRADRAQAESLRLIADSIKGRVMGPGGKTYEVLPGTRIVLTANTAGSGDVTGRYVSANPIDASILNRINQTFHFPFLDWRDEQEIVKDKFPTLWKELTEQEKDRLGVAVAEIRKKVALGELEDFEFSHRTLCAWLEAADDLLTEIIDEGLKRPEGLLNVTASTWLDRITEPELRLEVAKVLDPNLKGGALKTNLLKSLR